MCDFNPVQMPNPPGYGGNPLTFLLMIFEYIVKAILTGLFDLVGGLAVSLACLVADAILAPVNFLYGIFNNSIPSYGQFGPWAPIVAVLVFSVVVIILVMLFVLLFGVIGKQLENDVEEAEGKTPPGTSPEGEIGDIEEEL